MKPNKKLALPISPTINIISSLRTNLSQNPPTKMEPLFSHMLQEYSIVDKQLTIKNKAMEFKNGLTEQLTWANGKITNQMGRENSHILMEISTKASGKIIKPMVKADITEKQVVIMRELGKMMSLKVMELRSGEMEIYTKETSLEDINKVKETTIGRMDQSTKVNGMKEKLKDMDNTNIMMEGYMKAIGSRI